MADVLQFTRDGAIGRLTINRPEKQNMLTLAQLAELNQMLGKVGVDKELKAVVVGGAGADFCRGRDPAGAPEAAPTTALAMRGALIDPILGFYAAVRACEVPLIAAVQGAALGFGCAIASVADITIAADDARFAFPEMRHDLPPTLAMSAAMDRMPSKALLWMVYSTKEIDANTALSYGLASQVTSRAGLDTAVKEMTDTLTARRRDAIVTVKRYAQRARLADMPASADLAGNMLAVVLSSKSG
jgi:enoyl-CoA hydratase/carnithine racemase